MSNPLKILVVDDCQAVRLLASQMLEPYGASVQAGDGYDAYCQFLDALKSPDPFDLVLMDVIMPKLDGPGAVRLMREAENELDTPPTPVLMLSSIRDGKVILAAQYEAGADAYLSKPLTKQDLHMMLVNLGLADSTLEAI